MKLSNIFFGLLLFFLVVFAAGNYFAAAGSHRQLVLLQKIRHGLTKNAVSTIIDQTPSIVSGEDAPTWIEDVAGKNHGGEYWYFFVGYPPRNMIIYFDEDGEVVFATWADT